MSEFLSMRLLQSPLALTLAGFRNDKVY